MRASVARAATKCATSTRPPGTCVCRFRFFAEAEGLAQTKIQGEAPRAFRNIDRNTGLCDEERDQPKRVRQGHRSSEKHAMADVEGGAAVILADVEWIRRKAPRAGNIALGVV